MIIKNSSFRDVFQAKFLAILKLFIFLAILLIFIFSLDWLSVPFLPAILAVVFGVLFLFAFLNFLGLNFLMIKKIISTLKSIGTRRI